jgi:D-beta-D-heptose 7-phosphate kinase/D-beta-D-heptose 1-phosphate adenosyltransferase
MAVNAQRTLNLLEQEIPKLKALVVGDLMLDRYLYGVVERISPEAPVPVLRHARRSEQPGGAANAALNLAGLGVKTYLAGFWGGDADADALEGLLRKAGIDTTAVIACGRPTITKTRIVGHNQQLLRLDVESSELPSTAEMQTLIAKVVALVPQVQVVVLSDYSKGALEQSVCEAVIRVAKNAGVPVLVDPKSKDLGKYAGATTVCPNVGELALATGVAAGNLDELIRAGQQQVLRYGFEFLTLTMSERGIRILRRDSVFHSPAKAREVFDVSGAGDTVIATLAAALAAGMEAEDAVELANMAAGVVVGRRGTVAIHTEDLVTLLTPSAAVKAEDKLLDVQRAVQRVAEWRASGETIVFTNGCFDILHVGHIALLEECRRFGSKLVVGLNTDDSVRGLKGPDRPVVGERERARVMAALAATDAVVLFGEPTPLELIRALKPDVLVKGGDYTVESVVGHEDVHTWGGRVEIVPTVEGFSTTNIVKKLGGS